MALEDLRQERAGRVLHPDTALSAVEARRRPATGPVTAVLDQLWAVRWRRPEGMRQRQQVLSDPVVSLTVEVARAGLAEDAPAAPLHGHPSPATLVHGPVTRLFEVDLPPAGRTTGAMFHPGGYAVLLDVDVSALTDRATAAPALPGLDAVTAEVLATEDEDVRWDLLEDWLTRLHDRAADRIAGDTAYRAVRGAVDLMRRREQVHLAPVAEAVHCSERTLQRWFSRYVGVSPLRVLRRYRLQDATAALDAGESDLAGLAASLGWADHAHFTREFTSVVGVPPDRYRPKVTKR